ncbi:hypothetical protein [Solirhodobacter olei]|uniref:hypothetical protein n=1 Tax=Solirhodobacter olei TaxID=2493082 RepID=UPI000FD7A01D|nr:hypothetical protein [Solirhodobacter olei]
MNAVTKHSLAEGFGQRQGPFSRALAALGMTGEDASILSRVGPDAFNWVRYVFGLVLVYDAWTSLTWVHKVAVSQAIGLPTSAPALHLLVIVLAFVKIAIAAAIVSGRGVIPMSWAGIAYMAFVWTVFQHGGDFGKDGTDPGVALPYVVMFLFTIAVERMRTNPDVSRNQMLTLARSAFGLLWAYDALMKFHPYFLNHFTDFLTAAQTAMAGTWAAGYERLFLDITNAIGPHTVALLIAGTEALIAVSLLSGKGLRIMGPVGALLSLAIWSTAETFGAPYTSGVASSPAQLFGTASIYVLAFGYVMTLFNPLELLHKDAAPAVVNPA